MTPAPATAPPEEVPEWHPGDLLVLPDRGVCEVWDLLPDDRVWLHVRRDGAGWTILAAADLTDAAIRIESPPIRCPACIGGGLAIACPGAPIPVPAHCSECRGTGWMLRWQPRPRVTWLPPDGDPAGHVEGTA